MHNSNLEEIEKMNWKYVDNIKMVSLNEVTEILEELKSYESWVRKFIWLNHGCNDFAALYGDDGEMQCHKCKKDFKKMKSEELWKIYDESKVKKVEESKIIRFINRIKECKNKEDAANILGNYIYKHLLIFELLEGQELIYGNGHHIAQDLTEIVKEKLIERWNKE